MTIGQSSDSAARLQGFDTDGALICSTTAATVPDGHSTFIGFHDDTGRLAQLGVPDRAQAGPSWRYSTDWQIRASCCPWFRAL